jgi:hypothetical protein
MDWIFGEGERCAYLQSCNRNFVLGQKLFSRDMSTCRHYVRGNVAEQSESGTPGTREYLMTKCLIGKYRVLSTAGGLPESTA